MFFKFYLPGILLILMAFWVGSQSNLTLAFLGFLSFFVVGVALFAEGIKQSKKKSNR